MRYESVQSPVTRRLEQGADRARFARDISPFQKGKEKKEERGTYAVGARN